MSGLSCDRCRDLHVKCDVTRKPEDHYTWPGCNKCVEKAERTGEKVSDLCTNKHATLRAMKYLGHTGTQSIAPKAQPSQTLALSESLTPGTISRSPSPSMSLEISSSPEADSDVESDEDTESDISDVGGGRSRSSSCAGQSLPEDLSETVMQAAVALLQLSFMPEAWAATTLLSLSTGGSTAITA